MNLSLHHIRIVHSGLRTYVRTYVCVYEHRIKLLSNANIHMAVLSTKYVNTHVCKYKDPAHYLPIMEVKMCFTQTFLV